MRGLSFGRGGMPAVLEVEWEDGRLRLVRAVEWADDGQRLVRAVSGPGGGG